eukprot:GHRR01023664.1.p2 GENE.GHRR01023664.1~~GHRR01023664.1.p2  ORF type:complete len:104 (+),score=31.27 GHRR01023664.1:653-964(+)
MHTRTQTLSDSESSSCLTMGRSCDQLPALFQMSSSWIRAIKSLQLAPTASHVSPKIQGGRVLNYQKASAGEGMIPIASMLTSGLLLSHLQQPSLQFLPHADTG